MDSTTVRSRTAAATESRRRAAQDALGRVRDAIRQAHREKAQPSAAAIARRAGVSRSFIYDNAEARAAVAAALAQAGERRVQLLAEAGDQREATWRERALNAEDALKTAHAEITAQRARIGALLGQVRDLEAEWTKDAIARITTENTTLKQRVRQLTAENRTLEERLQAARSNNRFADRRIAQLEAEIADPETSRLCPNWPRRTPSSSPRCSSSLATGSNTTTTPLPRPWPGSSAPRTTAPTRYARTSPGSRSCSAPPTARTFSLRTSMNTPDLGSARGGIAHP